MKKKHLHKPWDVLRKAANGMIELPVKVRVHGGEDEETEELTLIAEMPGDISLVDEQGRYMAFCIFADEEWELLLDPKFKVGDLVLLHDYVQGEDVIQRIKEFNQDGDVLLANGCLTSKQTIIRHATPEEKKYHFWESVGREVDEYRVGDVFAIHGESSSIIKIENNGERVTDEFGNVYGFKHFGEELRLVCPVEQRLDR